MEEPRIDKESSLQSALKSNNGSVGPDELVPTLFVYGSLPRIGETNEYMTQSVYERK